jgi:hypothetical protein
LNRIKRRGRADLSRQRTRVAKRHHGGWDGPDNLGTHVTPLANIPCQGSFVHDTRYPERVLLRYQNGAIGTTDFSLPSGASVSRKTPLSLPLFRGRDGPRHLTSENILPVSKYHAP